MPGNPGTTMLHRTTFFSLTLLSVTTTLASSSAAAPPIAKDAPPEEATAPSDAHLRSLELALRPTIGGAGAGSPLHTGPGVRTDGVPSLLTGGSAPYGTAFGVDASLGFRFHPLISGGLRGGIASIAAASGPDATNLSRVRQTAGLYARLYPLALAEPLRAHFDPWIGVGAMYVHDAQSFGSTAKTNVGTTVNAAWQIDHHAIGIPVGVGLDYRLTKALSVGPSFEMVFLSPVAGCARQSASGFQDNRMCTDNDTTTKALVADAPLSWNVGLDLRVTPF